jgi:DNA-binding CsgD family transcriptional regulator
MNNIANIINKIDSINSKSNFNNFFNEIATMFQYDRANLIVFTPSPAKRNSFSVYGEIPEKIKCFISEDDSIRKYCFNESSPINYQTLLFENSKSGNNLFSHKQANLLIPINGFGNEFSCLLLVIPELSAQLGTLEKLGWYWLMLSSLIYDKYHKLFKPHHDITMTKRELECIKWAAEGKTSWEISKLLSISQRTVDFHLANCITKTDSINRQQAVVKCVLNGQLLAIL